MTILCDFGIWRHASSRPLRNCRPKCSNLGFLPDGRLVSASLDRTLRVWDLRRGTEQVVLRGPKRHVGGLAISPDGKWVAAGGDARVYLWDVTGGEPRSWKGDPTLVARVAVSPNGKTLAVIGSNNQVRTYEAESGRLLREFAFSCQMHGGLAFHPHADQLLFTGADGEVGKIMAWNPQTGKLLWNREFPSIITDLAFAPDGRQFAIARSDGTVNLCDSQTGNPGQVLKTQLRLHALAWSPNGQWLAAGGVGREVWVWNAKTGQEVTSLRQSNMIHAIAFAADSSRLAVGTLDGLIRLIPVDWQR